jgi:hypothetical protein
VAVAVGALRAVRRVWERSPRPSTCRLGQLGGRRGGSRAGRGGDACGSWAR